MLKNISIIFSITGSSLLLLTPFLTNISQAKEGIISDYSESEFKEYWYQHGAEISRFKLEQARYGEIHTGDAVLIFVTETFNSELQVKADTPDERSVPILKLNATRKFYTGIYPYSIMTSTFTPIDQSSITNPLKITSSFQEWCGHVFFQLNDKNNLYQIESRSYFETESDSTFTEPKSILEDGLWTLIRIHPEKLPTGKFRLFPSTTYSRLSHTPFKAHAAEGSLNSLKEKSLEEIPLMEYKINYVNQHRKVKIVFEKKFPFRIQRWEDSHKSIMGENILTTKAFRTHSIQLDYWNKHRNIDRKLLEKLGLDERQ